MARRFNGNLFALALSLLASLLVAEVALRLIVPPPIIFKHPQETYEFDSIIGHRLAPNQVSYTHDKPVLTNSFGVRGPEYSPEPAAGTYRILAIGDSQTFGNGLAWEDAWPGRLQQISNNGPRRVEVINGGVPGTDTWQHEILAHQLTELYQPDALVVAVYVNDVERTWVPRERAVFVSNSGRQRLKYLLRRSAIVSIAHAANRGYKAKKALSSSPQWEQRVIQGIIDPATEEAWAQVEASLRAVKDWSEAKRTYVLVVALPHPGQVNGSIAGEAFGQRLRDIARRNGMPFLDMLPALRAAYDVDGGGLFIPWDGHNSAVANRVVAEQVYHRISEVIGVP